MKQGRFFILGLGPGDPELMTVKAARILAAAPVLAFFAKRGRMGHARGIVEGLTMPGAEELRLEYPFTTEVSVADPRYLAEMGLVRRGFAVRCKKAAMSPCSARAIRFSMAPPCIFSTGWGLRLPPRSCQACPA